MAHFVLCTEGSSDGWGQPIATFKKVDDAVAYAVAETKKHFNLSDKAEIKVVKNKGENGAYLSISINATEDYHRWCGLDRELFKVKHYKEGNFSAEETLEFISNRIEKIS
jgi:hypothetical protein